MTEGQRARQTKAVGNILRHIDMVGQKHKLPLGVLDHLDDAYFAVERAEKELEIDWEKRAKDWADGTPKGKEN